MDLMLELGSLLLGEGTKGFRKFQVIVGHVYFFS